MKRLLTKFSKRNVEINIQLINEIQSIVNNLWFKGDYNVRDLNQIE